jgi:hypothetical protein
MSDRHAYPTPVDLGPPLRAEVTVHFRRADGSCVRYQRNLPLETKAWAWLIDHLLNSNWDGVPMELGDRPVGSECTDHVG